MNGMSDKEERDERNDQAYARWSLLRLHFTRVRLVGRLRELPSGFSGKVLVLTDNGKLFEVRFSGLRWQAIAAFTYAMHCSKAYAHARKAIRQVVRNDEGFDNIVEIPVPLPSREQSLKQIRTQRKKDKPRYLLGKPIR